MTECQAGCGVELHSAAAEGGFTVHPGCEPVEPATEHRWGCGFCRATGVADNAVHAAALGRTHLSYSCPATALTLDDPEHGFRSRVARRRAQTALYPDEVPPYTKPFR